MGSIELIIFIYNNFHIKVFLYNEDYFTRTGFLDDFYRSSFVFYFHRLGGGSYIKVKELIYVCYI